MPSKKKTKSVNDEMYKMMRSAEAALINTPIGEVISFEKMLNESAYGKLTPQMQQAMSLYVEGRRVFDLGAGDMTHSLALLKMKADDVIAIDKNFAGQKAPDKRIRQFEGTFNDYICKMRNYQRQGDVAFLSWPANHELSGLLDLLRSFKVIIYLGKNTDGSACAWPGFFEEMSKRSVLEYVPHARNSLLIWGETDGIKRDLLLEEKAGMDQSEMYHFQAKL